MKYFFLMFGFIYLTQICVYFADGKRCSRNFTTMAKFGLSAAPRPFGYPNGCIKKGGGGGGGGGGGVGGLIFIPFIFPLGPPLL